MTIHEFGKENSRKIVLIPGSMMCWRQFENVIPLLSKPVHFNLGPDGEKDVQHEQRLPECVLSQKRRANTAWM